MPKACVGSCEQPRAGRDPADRLAALLAEMDGCSSVSVYHHNDADWLVSRGVTVASGATDDTD